MKSKNTRFLMSLLLLIVVVAGVTMIVKSSLPQYVTPYWSLVLLFFAIVNIAIYFMTMKIKEKKDMGSLLISIWQLL